MNASTPLIEMHLERWDATPAPAVQAEAVAAIESGRVLFFPHLAFELDPNEARLLSPDWSDGKAKNISFDSRTEELSGAQGATTDLELLTGMIRRFSRRARGLIASLFPVYDAAVAVERTSFRPVAAADRDVSRRDDDRLLHVDAFPSRPNRGERILRVFSNVNPHGEPRVWRLGEPFDDLAARFLPGMRAPLPGSARLLAAVGITTGVRSGYDHIMLRLHDRMKADAAYQRSAPSSEVAFPPGTTWVCFSDQVSHAALRGQYILEQTLRLPVAAMHAPHRAPLRVLERLAGRSLA